MKVTSLLLVSVLSIGLMALASCQSPEEASQASSADPKLDYAIAIHAGAGVISKSVDESTRGEYEESLRQALELGRKMLDQGASGLDVVEQVIHLLEDDPKFNASKGAVYTHDGKHELDASIMDGRTLACGAVSGVTTVKHPISLARRVMENSRHVFFTGSGAEKFADQTDLERVEPSYFDTPHRYKQWQEKLQKEEQPTETGTVGVVVLDRQGNLAAGTSTGGMTDKRFGRVGDSPVIGAGTYANNRSVAVSCTGTGEEFIRNVVAHDIGALVEYKGISLQEAAQEVVHGKLKPGDGGIIAVSKKGEIALVFNSEGMFRGAADSSGRFEVAIWGGKEAGDRRQEAGTR